MNNGPHYLKKNYFKEKKFPKNLIRYMATFLADPKDLDNLAQVDKTFNTIIDDKEGYTYQALIRQNFPYLKTTCAQIYEKDPRELYRLEYNAQAIIHRYMFNDIFLFPRLAHSQIDHNIKQAAISGDITTIKKAELDKKIEQELIYLAIANGQLDINYLDEYFKESSDRKQERALQSLFGAACAIGKLWVAEKILARFEEKLTSLYPMNPLLQNLDNRKRWGAECAIQHNHCGMVKWLLNQVIPLEKEQAVQRLSIEFPLCATVKFDRPHITKLILNIVKENRMKIRNRELRVWADGPGLNNAPPKVKQILEAALLENVHPIKKALRAVSNFISSAATSFIQQFSTQKAEKRKLEDMENPDDNSNDEHKRQKVAENTPILVNFNNQNNNLLENIENIENEEQDNSEDEKEVHRNDPPKKK